MPSRRRYKKKKGGRRRRYAVTNVVRQPQVVANSQIVKFRYSDYVSLNAGTNDLAVDAWSCTSLTDPYPALGGHQPLGFDQWMSFYHKYVVVGAKITAYADVYSTAAADAICLLGKVSETQDGVATSVDQAIEQRKSKWKFLTSRQGSRSAGSIQLFYSPKKFLGINSIRDQGNLRGTINDDPTRQCYFNIAVGGINTSDNPTAVNVRVVIEYTALLTEPKDLGQS